MRGRSSSQVEHYFEEFLGYDVNHYSDLVIQRLIDTHSFSNVTQTNVAWLVRLGFEDRAREAYLKARTGVISKRTR